MASPRRCASARVEPLCHSDHGPSCSGCSWRMRSSSSSSVTAASHCDSIAISLARIRAACAKEGSSRSREIARRSSATLAVGLAHKPLLTSAAIGCACRLPNLDARNLQRAGSLMRPNNLFRPPFGNRVLRPGSCAVRLQLDVRCAIRRLRGTRGRCVVRGRAAPPRGRRARCAPLVLSALAPFAL
jgi:hypothetical protein